MRATRFYADTGLGCAVLTCGHVYVGVTPGQWNDYTAEFVCGRCVAHPAPLTVRDSDGGVVHDHYPFWVKS